MRLSCLTMISEYLFLKEWIDVDLHMYSLACAWQIIWIRKILHAETNKKQLQPPRYAKMNQRNALPRTLIYLQKWWLIDKPFLLKWSLFKRSFIFQGSYEKNDQFPLSSQWASLAPSMGVYALWSNAAPTTHWLYFGQEACHWSGN